MMIQNSNLSAGDFKSKVRQESGASRVYEDDGNQALVIGVPYARLIGKRYNLDPQFGSLIRISPVVDPSLHMLGVLFHEIISMKIVSPGAPFYGSFYSAAKIHTSQDFLNQLKEMLRVDNKRVIEILDEAFNNAQV